jgi:glycerol-3-phosphate dehydrogenase
MDPHLNPKMEPRRSLEKERFHVVVIGGGINGVAIARECARAGRRTLLLEQHDFASGTTSRSTRIIHGGLRYLEHGDIGQVRESLRERQWLLQRYPHLVNPLQFLLALDQNSHRSALAIRAGLWLYRRLNRQKTARESGTGRTEQDRIERLLDAGRRFSIFSFEDAQCEFPERLVAEWLVEAIEAGAVARNHTQVLAVETSNGRVTGVVMRDGLSGKEERVEATWVINATGPWADNICESSGIHTGNPMVGGVRGSHIVLSKFAGAPDAAVYTEAVDGRPIFVIPWNEQVLVGTTEVQDRGDPGRVQPSADEIDYLLRSLLHLFPRIRVAQQDIHFAFAGVRPLPFSPEKNPSAISRKHYLHDHAPDGAAQMLSVIGGKLTTAGSLARECAAQIGARSASPTLAAASLAVASLAVASEDGVDRLMDQLVTGTAEAGGISRASARAIVEWHGRRSLAIAALALNSAALRAPLCPHTEHIVAEAVNAFANECAVTLADVLLRRVPVALGACWSPECSREAATRIAPTVGWNQERISAEMEAFEAERQAFLQKPANINNAVEAVAN